MMASREAIYMSRAMAGAVKRYHTWPMLMPQTIAEHSWNVACIYIEIFTLPRSDVLYYILHHDSGEMWAGDVPFGAKARIPGLSDLLKQSEQEGLRKLNIKLPELTELECVKVKIADLLEMYEKGHIEMLMGNKLAEPVVYDTIHKAQKLAGEHELSESVNKWLTCHALR